METWGAARTVRLREAYHQWDPRFLSTTSVTNGITTAGPGPAGLPEELQRSL